MDVLAKLHLVYIGAHEEELSKLASGCVTELCDKSGVNEDSHCWVMVAQAFHPSA